MLKLQVHVCRHRDDEARLLEAIQAAQDVSLVEVIHGSVVLQRLARWALQEGFKGRVASKAEGLVIYTRDGEGLMHCSRAMERRGGCGWWCLSERMSESYKGMMHGSLLRSWTAMSSTARLMLDIIRG
jgi:hypothetical protein